MKQGRRSADVCLWCESQDLVVAQLHKVLYVRLLDGSQIEYAADGENAFDNILRDTIRIGPRRQCCHCRKLPADGMSGEMNLARIATVRGDVGVEPSDRRADLTGYLRHRYGWTQRVIADCYQSPRLGEATCDHAPMHLGELIPIPPVDEKMNRCPPYRTRRDEQVERLGNG